MFKPWIGSPALFSALSHNSQNKSMSALIRVFFLFSFLTPERKERKEEQFLNHSSIHGNDFNYQIICWQTLLADVPATWKDNKWTSSLLWSWHWECLLNLLSGRILGNNTSGNLCEEFVMSLTCSASIVHTTLAAGSLYFKEIAVWINIIRM